MGLRTAFNLETIIHNVKEFHACYPVTIERTPRRGHNGREQTDCLQQVHQTLQGAHIHTMN